MFNTADDYLALVQNWEDPYPAPVIEQHHGFYIVRDDLLGYGSKARFIDYLVKTDGQEWVFGGANKVGWGPISLTHVCNRYGKRATFFMPQRTTNPPTWHQQHVLNTGGTIHWVKAGMLNVTLSHARRYYEEDPIHRRILPLGLDHPTVLGSIIKVARALPITPTEIWTVASSGTLSRGLQLAFPNLSVYTVEVGHKMSDAQRGRAIVFRSPYKYDQAVKGDDIPPYPSEPFYDAKVWSFMKQHAKQGALCWNVA